MKNPLWILVFIAGGLTMSMLAVLLIRGRFGTPGEQGVYELNELARSSEVPSGARLRGLATCRGHGVNSRQILGAGVLWLADDSIGFVLRQPRRHLRIPLSEVRSATTAASYRHGTIEEVCEDGEFLVVEWVSSSGTGLVGWQVDDPAAWAAEISALLG